MEKDNSDRFAPERFAKKISYNLNEDSRFPVALLHKGFYILKTHGQQPFLNFAMDCYMPSQDIERVLNKYKYKTDPKFRAEIKAIAERIRNKLKGTDLETDMEEIPF